MNSSTENSNNIAETLKTHCPKINLKLCRKTVFTTNAVEVTVQYMSGTKTEHTVQYMYGCMQYMHSIWDKLSF